MHHGAGGVRALLLASCLLLVVPTIAGCAAPIVTGGSATSPAIDRAEAAYARIRSATEIVLPFLPDSHASRVRAALVIADRALLAARLATDAVARAAELRRVERATAAIAASLPAN